MNIQAKYRSKKTYYIHGIGLAYEVTFNSSGAETNILYYHYDQLGSTNAITNSSGAITDRVEYDIYGRTLYRSGTTDTPYLYVGQFGIQTDPSGLHHMRARYYNPLLMRFINADPIGFSGGSNWYAYANNSPLIYIDPSGLCPSLDGGGSWITNALSSAWTFTKRSFGATIDGIYNVGVDIEWLLLKAATGVYAVYDTTPWTQVDAYTDGLRNITMRAGWYEENWGSSLVKNTIMIGSIVAGSGVAGGTKSAITTAGTTANAGRTITAVENAATVANPFKGKTAQKIEDMLTKKGYEPRGPDPLTGRGGYVNPQNGRSYHIDPANKFGEPSHVDVNRLPKNTPELPKKKYPFGE